MASKLKKGQPGGNKHKRIRLSFSLDPSTQRLFNPEVLVGSSSTPVSGVTEIGRDYQVADVNQSLRPSTSFSRDDSRSEASLRGHASLQNRLAKHLQILSLDARSPTRDEPDFDLAWAKGADIFVAEIKTLSGTDPVGQLRLGLGQVLHYRRMLQDSRHSLVTAVLAVEHDPGPLWLNICYDASVILTWPDEWRALS